MKHSLVQVTTSVPLGFYSCLPINFFFSTFFDDHQTSITTWIPSPLHKTLISSVTNLCGLWLRLFLVVVGGRHFRRRTFGWHDVRTGAGLYGRARNEESLRTPLLPVGAPPSPANRTTTVARGRSPEEIFFDPRRPVFKPNVRFV